MASPLSGAHAVPSTHTGAASAAALTTTAAAASPAPGQAMLASANKVQAAAQPIHAGSATAQISAVVPAAALPPAAAAVNADHLLTGQGKRVYPDGRVDVGTFLAGKLHGQGKSTMPNGEEREGEFRNGLLHGKGTLTYKPGMWIEGQFQDGQPHGKCKFFSGMNSVENEYENGEIRSFGTPYNEYEGRFESRCGLDLFNCPGQGQGPG